MTKGIIELRSKATMPKENKMTIGERISMQILNDAKHSLDMLLEKTAAEKIPAAKQNVELRSILAKLRERRMWLEEESKKFFSIEGDSEGDSEEDPE